ncbi:hypothetical protein I3760_15G118500 [Carya illinoinensis]|nr:hypothetical protein I3760_15G118500 [Carya illinoinensis]
MPSITSPQWHEMVSSFFSSSREKLKEAGQSAEKFIRKVAKDAKRLSCLEDYNFTHVAEHVGSVPSTRNAVHKRLIVRRLCGFTATLISVAATTNTLLRKTKVEEVAKKPAPKSKTILTDIERWQKRVASTDVCVIPSEVTVQQQQSSRLITHILAKCAYY